MITGNKKGDISFFYKEYTKEYVVEKKDDNCFIINAHLTGERINKSNTLVLLPYCLKKINCDHRIDYSCELQCYECEVGDLCRFLRKKEFHYEFIIYDDIDVPKWIKLHEKNYGPLKFAIVVLCPTAALENERFVSYYKNKTKILFYFIDGFEECDFKKATLGKFWGKTHIDISHLKKCINNYIQENSSSSPVP